MQTGICKAWVESRRMKDTVKLWRKVAELYQGHLFALPFQGGLAVRVPSGQRHSCTCVSGRRGTSNYGSYYTSIQSNADKGACFETGNALDSGTERHATATRCRKTQTEGVTDRQWDKDVQSRRRTGGGWRRGLPGNAGWGFGGEGLWRLSLMWVSVVSIFDNNSGDVIIGSLIKINLISATHDIFCLLKRCLASLEAGIHAPS